MADLIMWNLMTLDSSALSSGIVILRYALRN
jgi:hypothetical protein